MKTLHFKTNINCSACVAKVSPILDVYKGIKSWNVDTDNPNKILKVEVEEIEPDAFIHALNKIGYKAELL